MSVIEGVNTMQTNATTGAGLGYEVSRAEALAMIFLLAPQRPAESWWAEA